MKRMMSIVLAMALALSVAVIVPTRMEVKAAMADEAFDYELGETYTGQYKGSKGKIYYRFEVPQKSHVSFEFSNNYKSDSTWNTKLYIYDSVANVVVPDNAFIFTRDAANGLWKTSQYRVLTRGTYYIRIDGSATTWDYEFSIQAEPQITLPKGQIKSAKSTESGKLTVTYASVSDAEEYRVQVSTNRKFKSKVKTVYATSTKQTFSGLAKGKTYYVRVAPCSMYSDGERAFGQNSLVKSVKIKG